MPTLPRRPLFATALVLAAACSGHDPQVVGSATPVDFVVLGASPGAAASAWLDDPVLVTFNQPLDLDSVSPATFGFLAVDSHGQPTDDPVVGTFQLANDGSQLRFQPQLPTGAALANAGLRPGRTYQVQLAGGSGGGSPVLRSAAGKALAAPFAFTFTTRDGSAAAELFHDPRPGGPRRSGLAVSTTTDLEAVPLGLFGTPPLEVRLTFDQPLDPSPDNVPTALDTDPLVRDASQKGRIFLEYDDVEAAPGTSTWIPADVELERNAIDGATVVLRPVGVLPNNATVRVIVEPSLRDLVGESNATTSGYDRVFGSLRTAAAWQQQWNGLVERFAADAPIDARAGFPEPLAEVGPGHLRASFAFDGAPTTYDYTPLAAETILNTHVATLQGTAGAPRTVSGGVFAVRDLTIPQGHVVRGQGSNPLVFVCSGKVTIAGTLTVRGGNGTTAIRGGQYMGPRDRVGGSQPWNPSHQANGGVGPCGGGDGGKGSPQSVLRNRRGGTGEGAGGSQGQGGRGGYLACVAGCYTGLGYNSSGGGSGGGGGSFITQGDPHYRGSLPPGVQILPNTPPTANTMFQQVRGYGGSGCSGGSGSRTAFLAGGEPAPAVPNDARNDNDFWGSGYDARRQLRITGELALPTGGAGGGGGANTSPQFDCSLFGNDPAAMDHRGGGGGAGGGVVIVKALGEIHILSTGRVVADGGHGGGGEQVGACGEAGGGGGGSGGMVVLMSATAIRIEAHGSATQNRFVYGDGSNGPFAGNDYDFAVSADGGICTTGGFGAINVVSKYPAGGQVPLSGPTYDGDPLGGFGGMGLVQLMAPSGDNSDGTNTILDDHIHFHRPGDLSDTPLPAPLPANAKRQLLAWRGFPDASGTPVDDFGNPTAIGNNEGDLRPAPVLLPAPFGARSRARSRWIDTGASERRPLAAPDEFPRGLVLGDGAVVGPRYSFAGTDAATGFAAWTTLGPAGVRLDPVVVVPITALASADPAATFLGQPAYRLRAAAPVLGTPDRFATYDAELVTASGTRLAAFRILGHDAQDLLVVPGETLPVAATHLRVVARCFDVSTDDAPGLPGWLPPGRADAVPSANVRFGFAFHTDPAATNPLAGRYPAEAGAFAYDLADPALQAWVATNHPRFVMWDVLFDLAHDAGFGAPPLAASPRRLTLHSLRLPFRF